MKKENKKTNRLLITIIFAFMILLFLLLYFILKIKLINAENEQKNIEISYSENTPKVSTVETILEKYESNLIDKKTNIIYVDFKEDLYDEDGNSNENYFDNVIYELTELDEFSEKGFVIIDEEKDIKIEVLYNIVTSEHEKKYNNIEEFFENTDGEKYSAINNLERIKTKSVTLGSEELLNLKNGNMFFSKIKDGLGEGILLENGYTSFKEGAILVKILNGKVRNIVFKENYDSTVINGVKVGDSLDEVAKIQSNVVAGSPEDGYLLYVTADLYIFVYEDEISAYGYSYFANTDFETFIEEYLIDKNLDKFIQKVSKKWTNHDIYEYNSEEQTAHITFPSRGVEIDIDDNGSSGIILYKNYYFTDKTKQMVKDGKITLKENEDILVLTEEKRRENIR